MKTILKRFLCLLMPVLFLLACKSKTEKKSISSAEKVSNFNDGVFLLKKDQDTDGIEMKNFSKTYRALEMYDVEKLYVDKQSLEERGLTEDDLLVDVEIKTTDELTALMEDQEVVVSF